MRYEPRTRDRLPPWPGTLPVEALPLIEEVGLVTNAGITSQPFDLALHPIVCD